MSVERDGVQGYEYQYLCSILIALNLFKNNRDVQSIDIEKHEDAYFKVIGHKQTWRIYFQGKKHDKKITFNDLCVWLSHYGERQVEKSLLERIVYENANLVIFSFGRCEDAIEKFTRFDENSYTNTFSASNDFIDNLKNEIVCSMNEATDIENKRKSNMKQFINKVNKHDLRNALKRICINEQLKKDKVESIIAEILNKEFFIRKRDVDVVISKLDKCVRNGRDTGENIKDDFLQIINLYANKLLKGEYIIPPQYQELVDYIEKNNVLLITGVPFCGKTITARFIAEKYQKEGYTISERDVVSGDNSAYSFLCNSQFDDSKLVIISDPFGGYEKNEKVSETKHKIETIINNLTDSCKKVIITTRKDILLETLNKTDIKECDISGNRWYDLSMNDVDFAKKIWIKLFKDNLNSMELFNRIQKSLYKDNCSFLEAGEIFHLYTKYKTIEDFQDFSENDIINESRISAEDIKNRIKNSETDFITTYIALGLSCNSVRSVTINDLAFVLSDSNETPGIVERRNNSVDLFGSSKHFPFPSYSVSFELTQKQKDILRKFRDSGYIYI